MNTENVLAIFKDITTVPRESGHEEKIIAWLEAFAQKHSLPFKKDSAGNVLIIKEADPGFEDRPVIILQSHCDMVCEKVSGSKHDFSRDPVKYEVKDGWMIARETTLGADCGIGMACALDLLTSEDRTGRLEALFTVCEETGLDGAKALKKGFFTGRTLINLDNEDEGEICVGCAGGLDTTAKFTWKPEPVASCMEWFRLSVTGCIGGHSGDDINKGRANAVQLLAGVLYDLSGLDWQLVSIDGGNKRNAIARDASAILAVSPSCIPAMKRKVNNFRKNAMEQYGNVEKDMQITMENTDVCGIEAIDSITAGKLVCALCSCPHGVLAMSMEVDGFVETSTNLASVKMTPGNVIRIGTSQRSCVTASRRDAGRKVEACFTLAGAKVRHESEYPGWAPSQVSPIRDACINSYVERFGREPIVRAIHAGLECGLFTKEYPELDMISIGPTLRGVHAPGERLNLASLERFTRLLEHLVTHFQ